MPRAKHINESRIEWKVTPPPLSHPPTQVLKLVCKRHLREALSAYYESPVRSKGSLLDFMWPVLPFAQSSTKTKGKANASKQTRKPAKRRDGLASPSPTLVPNYTYRGDFLNSFHLAASGMVKWPHGKRRRVQHHRIRRPHQRADLLPPFFWDWTSSVHPT